MKLDARPSEAHDELKAVMGKMGNGLVWLWANNTAAPDETTNAYMEAVRALEELRRHLLRDASQAWYASLEAEA